MADEVPVSDVLCEAMEYLTKLGSNLRTRSENLKEKRINKNKLKNTHAVQKAASKVLLICELSKKSLDNVESGVRRVLSLLDTPGASSSIGGKTVNKKHTSSKGHYIEYKSHKLRISRKIAIKHYMSAKVLAKRMPASMCEKYPVYIDCKLYRSRRKLLEQKKSKDSAEQCRKRKSSINKSDTEQTSKHQGNDLTQDTKINAHNKISKVPSVCVNQKEKSNKDGGGEDNVGKSKSNMDEVADHNQFYEKNKEIIISVTESDSKNGTHDRESRRSLNENEIDEEVPAKKNEYDSDNSRHTKNRESSVINNENESLTSSKRSTRMVSDTDAKKWQEKNSHKHRKQEVDSKQKKYKHLIIPQDSSDDEDVEKQRNSPEKDKILASSSSDEKKKENCPLRESKHKKRKFSDAGNVSPEQVASYKEITEKENVGREDKDDISDDGKPLIRCVNISKLLKPDVLVKVADKIIKTGTKNNKELSIRKKKNELIQEETGKRMNNERKSTADSCQNVNVDEEYWARKRKEVRSFKAKEFSINITRLPILSVNFLCSHSLTRITQDGAVICETEKSYEKNKKSVEDLSEVKSALLNDSESDNETALPVAVASKKVKDCLLNDSDSDNTVQTDSHSRDNTTKIKTVHSKESKSKEKLRSNNGALVTNIDSELNKENSPTKIKHALLNDSDSDKSDELGEGENCENAASVEKTNDIENIKDALLNESDSDKNEEQDNNDKNKEDESYQFTHEEFREFEKKVTEIIKTSLLNDSDSDKIDNKEMDTETKNKDDDKIQDCNEGSENNEQSKNNTADESEDNSNGKDSDKPSPSKDPELVKSALLNDSSDSGSEAQKTSKEKKIPQKKHDEDSVNAKKKLLNYSSSSDAENERSQSSTVENVTKKTKRKHRKKISRRSTCSTSSNEDLVKNPQKKFKLESKSSNIQSQGSASDNSTSNKSAATDKTTSRKMVRSKAKPSGSSGQSSDNQDDKDIDGLTNLNNLNKSHRRRDSASTTGTNNTQDTSSITKIRSKVTIGEDLLQPESSSDNISDNGHNDDSDIEELPPIPMTGLNGGSIDHLAKDDLLNDSDSSGSHDKDDKNEVAENMDDSEEENNVKAKRRKANAISSDSEVGSSRRKQRDVRVSDFEDSEAECSEPNKKSKRKKASDSDGSSGSSGSDAGKKKRRRIKQLNDSDGSGSDTENEGRNKHGRKNIRKVMGKNQLEEATKKAAREEKERIARITERQKLYNNLEFDESGKPDEVVLEKVVLDFDPETKEPLIEVDRGLVKKLKPHQANGIKFMWDACFESVKRIKKDRGSGCILAHCMGLGKTLQVISLTHTLLSAERLTGVRRVLVVCPLSTVLNWVGEFRMWLTHAVADKDVDIYELSRYKQNSERAYQLRQWLEGGGVCVLGYEMFRNLSADNTKKYKKKMLKSFQESLLDPGPDLVVCDEGHLLKNEKTSLSQSMNRVRTRRRIVLTGTPLQNNLKEYYCMVQFVKPNLLGKYNEYLNRFVNPITNGQYTDSTEQDIRVMKRRSHVLHKMLDGAVQRRDYGVLAPFLPPKHEYVLFITLTDVQVKLYQHYLDNYSRRPLPGKSSGFLFPDFQSLQRIWTHPLVLKYNSERYEIMQQKKREREEEDDSEGSLADFIDDDSTPDESSTEDSSDDLSDLSDDSRKKSKKKKAGKKGKGKDAKVAARRGTRANPIEVEDDDPAVEEVVEVRNENPTEWWIKLVADEELQDLRNSHKLVLLFDILRQCEAIGDKLLVFSQSLYSLDLIEHFLGKVDEATQEGRIDEKLGSHIGTWSPGVDYFRLDGSTSCENRSIWCKNFNREDNPRARLFLISTRAGGLGINLVAANRVVIFDVSWNPSHDVQSIFRVYRFGQKKPCYVYRFLAMGTMEEKIYERQVTKQAISKRVIDEQQIDRHYAENDLAELYTFQPRPDEPRALPTLPKDRLFAEMLKEHDVQIYKYHEHDSLLENKEEETLSEEERKAAWEDFENEKSRPPPAPFPAPWPLHNGMVPGLLAQQQQQLAMAALTAMLRKDVPNINENQIREMLPLIYNSNPGLMQKMGEIYKYAQPGMMNPGMMNPAMTPGGGGGGGMSGTSGLQYEPPWQRQQQQQHQMRLQQLLQQQNQMGAKFYAGGLGSRDPVAMALQQQRAREIMLSGGGTGGSGGGTGGSGGGSGGGSAGGGRPRGRPPLQPRAPPALNTPAGDVVDLDSD